ncbi:hypothetical protein Droror1_Dr00023550 [Drosera rotundifolia]
MDQCEVLEHQYVPPLDDIEEPAEIDDALFKLVTTIRILATKKAFDTRIQNLEEDLRIAKNNVTDEIKLHNETQEKCIFLRNECTKMKADLLNVDAKEAETTIQNLQTKVDEKMESLRALKEEIKELTKEGELLREKNRELLNENNSLKLVEPKCKQAFEKMKKKKDLLGMELPRIKTKEAEVSVPVDSDLKKRKKTVEESDDKKKKEPKVAEEDQEDKDIKMKKASNDKEDTEEVMYISGGKKRKPPKRKAKKIEVLKFVDDDLKEKLNQITRTYDKGLSLSPSSLTTAIIQISATALLCQATTPPPPPLSPPHHAAHHLSSLVPISARFGLSLLLVFYGRTRRRCGDSALGTRVDRGRQCGGGLGFRRGKDGVDGRWWPRLLVVDPGGGWGFFFFFLFLV